MSVFEGVDNQNTEAAEANQGQTNQSFVQKLAEAKGDKWRDPEVIAKGKLDADAYIEQLKAELEATKKLAERAAKIEELAAKLEQKAAEPNTATASFNPVGATATQTKSALSEEDVQSLVEKTLTKREQTQTIDQNIKQVDTQLQEIFGTEAKQKLIEKSKELGLSVSRLKEIAGESPTAFFSIIGEKPKEFRPMTNGSVRTEGVSQQSSGDRTNAYYQKMRKDNPRLFQQSTEQMLQDRIRLGDRFYK